MEKIKIIKRKGVYWIIEPSQNEDIVIGGPFDDWDMAADYFIRMDYHLPLV